MILLFIHLYILKGDIKDSTWQKFLDLDNCPDILVHFLDTYLIKISKKSKKF